MKNRIIFFCYPGIGILEQWLPIITQLKKKKIKIDILFFNFDHLCQFEKDNFTHVEALKIFDNFFYDTGDKIVQLKSFRINSLNNNYLSKLLFKFKSIFTSGLKFKIFIMNYNKILYDTYFDLVDRFNYSSLINDKIKFSIHHGVALFNRKNKNEKFFWRVNDTIYYPKNRKDIKNLTVFNYTADEINFWKFIYINKKIKNFKIPIFKNDDLWVKKILKNSKISKPKFDKKYFFLLSRPANDKYLSLDQKKNLFIDLVEICKDFKMKLVIKFHPKENKKYWSNFYLHILKKFNVDHEFSEIHSFAVAKHSEITFSFFSELVVSLAYLKVPVIEYLPLQNKKESNSFLLDKNNNNVFAYRYSNLTHGASDKQSLKMQIHKIINNRKLAIKTTYDKYNSLFSTDFLKISKVIELIKK
tara:strand:+ start:688 stop:1932 length:1245 start_codon:yes stop_codon:yes gene_type:complete